MKILIITQLYPQPDDYGDNKPTKTVEYFAKEWVNFGHKVVVIHCSSKFPYLFYLIPSFLKNKLAGKTSNIIPSMSSRKKIERKEYGIKIYRFPMFKIFPGQGYSQRIIKKQISRIYSVLDTIRFKPDLVVGHFANPSTELVANIAIKYNAKSSIVFHGDCNIKTIKRYRIKKKVANIGAVGARSIVEANHIKDILDLSYTPFICYSGVPNKALCTAATQCEKHDFSKGIKYLYVGSFIKRKNVDIVIKAFDKTANFNDVLTIVGGGPEEATLKEIAKKCIHAKQIVFTGKVERNKVLQYMKEAHIFTLVSTGEVFGMVYIESMLQGCLTIASKNGGFDGIITTGENGFICNPGDENALICVYSQIKNMSKESLNEVGKKAIETALHYSEREVAQKYLNNILKINDMRGEV